MSDFESRARLFHQYCDEMRVDAAFEMAERLGAAAITVAEHFMLGICQLRIGLFTQAERSLQAILPVIPPDEPGIARVKAELAAVKNQLGKVEEGAALEKQLYTRSRCTMDDPERAAFIPLFRERMLEDGEAVAGKSVFMVMAGGLGDAIEQLRNIDNLLADGAIHVCTNPAASLRELIANAAIPVTQQRGTLEELARCDRLVTGNMLNWRYWRGGAPLALHAAYLRPVRPRQTPVRVAPQPGKRKIGIVWRSTNATWLQCRHEPFRSMSLAALEPLLADPRSRFHSLQFGALTEAEHAILSRHDVVNAGPAIRSFADLADIVMQLDLVITVDSAPAHLCGALDAPVWMLLAQVSDWRWGDAAQRTTPHYRSMRLFRQKALGDWGPVVAQVYAELARVDVPEH